MQKWTTLILIFLFPWIIKAQKPKNYTTEFLEAQILIKPNSKKILGKIKYAIVSRKDIDFIKLDAPGLIIKK